MSLARSRPLARLASWWSERRRQRIESRRPNRRTVTRDTTAWRSVAETVTQNREPFSSQWHDVPGTLRTLQGLTWFREDQDALERGEEVVGRQWRE